MKHLAEIRVDLDAIEFNLKWIAERAGSLDRVLPMIKADAYGHGAVELALFYQKMGVKQFGVAHIEEAVELRKANVVSELVVFQPGFRLDSQAYRKYNLQAVVNSPEDLVALSGEGIVKFHLMIDSGMGREGMLPDMLNTFLDYFQKTKNLEWVGICTHFAQSDEEDSAPTLRQIERFETVLNLLQSEQRKKLTVHAANSGAIINFPQATYDWVRPGILLYGIYAGAGEVTQKPAMSVHAVLVHKKWVPEGSAIGYGATFTTDKPTLLGIFSLGYADGMLRLHSNNAQVWKDGESFPVLGRVSMDQIVVDLNAMESIPLGSDFLIWGGKANMPSSLAFEAEHSNTITYERSCQLGMMRMPRLFHHSGDFVGQ